MVGPRKRAKARKQVSGKEGDQSLNLRALGAPSPRVTARNIEVKESEAPVSGRIFGRSYD